MDVDSQSMLRALISLLEDNNPKVLAAVRERLLDLGPGSVAHLRTAMQDDNPRLRMRARDLLEEMEVRERCGVSERIHPRSRRRRATGPR